MLCATKNLAKPAFKRRFDPGWSTPDKSCRTSAGQIWVKNPR